MQGHRRPRRLDHLDPEPRDSRRHLIRRKPDRRLDMALLRSPITSIAPPLEIIVDPSARGKWKRRKIDVMDRLV